MKKFIFYNIVLIYWINL